MITQEKREQVGAHRPIVHPVILALQLAVAATLLLLLAACEDPPAVPDLVYWDAVSDVQDSINAHRQYSPADQVVNIGGAGVVPAYPFNGLTDTAVGAPKPFATIKLAAGRSPGQEYAGTVYLFPGKGDLNYYNQPLIVGDALDPYNERSALTIYADPQYSKLLSVDRTYPRGLGYDIYFIDFSQGAGDILINSALELAFVEWLQQRLDPGANIIIAGPSMSGIVARIAMLYALPENNTTGTYLTPRVTGYFSVDSPHQGASLDPSLTIAARAFYKAMIDGWGASHDKAAGYALHSWQQSTTPATFQMLYAHEVLGLDPSSGGHDLFYGFIAEMGQYNRRMPRAAIAYSNFFVPHQDTNPVQRRVVGQFKVRVKVPFNPIDFSQDFSAGGSLLPVASALERAGYYELTPGSVGGRFYWSPYKNQGANDYVKPNTSANGEVYKGTHIPIASALDLDPSFNVFNPPTMDETELARYSNFDAVYYMKNEYNGYRPNSRTINDKRYEHIVFDDQLMASIADALAFLEEQSRQPATISDRYDIRVGQETTISAPGLLANDAAANGSPAVYSLTKYPLAGYLAESIEQGPSASLNWGSCTRCGKSFTALMIGAEKRFIYLYNPASTSATHIVSSPVSVPSARQDLTVELHAPDPAVDTPLATTTTNGDPRLYYLAKDTYRVQEMGWWAGAWHYRDLATDANAPPAMQGSVLAATSITNGDPRVYYVADINGVIHIQELAWRTLGTRWYLRDLTAQTGAPSPIPGSPLAAIAIDSEPRVYYIGPGPHIYELAWDVDHWRWGTITPYSPPLLHGSKLTAVTINNQPRVYFVTGGAGANVDIWEIARSGTGWVMTNLSTLTSAPPVFGPSLIAANVNGEPFIYYTAAGARISSDVSQNIHVLTIVDGRWHDYDLTTPYHNPPRWMVDVQATLTLSALTVDRPSLPAELVQDVAHGRLVLHEDGSFVYKPDTGFAGTDSFTYRISTPFARSSETQVLLQVTNECLTPAGNLVANPCFEGTPSPWQFYSSRYGSFQISPSNPFDGLSSAVISIRHLSRNIQLYQEGIALQPNTTYKLSFAARSSNGRDMAIWVHKHNDPYQSYGLAGQRVALDRDWRQFEFTFVTPNLADMKNARLRFWLGPYAGLGTVYQIDDVVLTPVK